MEEHLCTFTLVFRPNSLRKPLKKSLIFWKYDVTRMFPHNPQIPTLNHENIEVIDRRRVVFNLSVRKPPNWLYFQCKIPLYELLITGPLLSPPAQDLPPPDPISGSFSDPYIRISLLPGVDERVRQSSVKRRTLNPYFNEYFKFPLDFDDVKVSSTLAY